MCRVEFSIKEYDYMHWDGGDTMASTAGTLLTLSLLYSTGLCQTPELTIQPDTVWEPSGTTVTLTCNVQGRTGEVTWYKDGQLYSQAGGNNPLYLSLYTVENEDGSWTCQLSPDNGTDVTSDLKTLTVNSYPQNTPALGPKTIDAYNTNTMIAECVFISRPDNNITWTFHNGSQLPSDVFDIKPAVSTLDKYHQRTATLKWETRVTTSDKIMMGNVQFTCSSEIPNVVNSKKWALFDLTVVYKPTWLTVTGGPASVTVTEGVDVRRTCEAACSPACTYQWTGPRAVNGPTLTLDDVNKASAGTYTCQASNDYGANTTSFVLDVEYSPGSMQLSLPTGSPVAGTTVTFTCRVDSKPGSQISFHNVSSDSPALHTETGVTEAHYVVADAECHTMTVHCKASNKVSGQLGRDPVSAAIGVRVQCAPTVYYTNAESGLVSVSPGVSAEILVGVLAYPFPGQTQRAWSFQPRDQGSNGTGSGGAQAGSSLPENAREGAIDGNVLSLFILETAQHNVGQYTLTAGNGHGQTEYTVALVLEEDSGGVSAGLVAGCVVGAVVLAGIVIVVVLMYRNIIPRPEKSLERLRSASKRRTPNNKDKPTKTIGLPRLERRPTNDYESDGPRSSTCNRETMDFEPIVEPTGTPSYIHTDRLDDIHANIAGGIQTMPIAQINTGILMKSQQKPHISQKPKPNVGRKPKGQRTKEAELHTYKTWELKLGEALHHGTFYCTQTAQCLAEPDQLLVVKRARESTGPVGTIYWQYVRSQAECLRKLQDNPYVLPCSGIIYDDGILHAMVMPQNGMGSVREYLRASNIYENLSSKDKPHELMMLVHEIVSGLVAISNIKTNEPILHYALSADHVLLSAEKVCQVTGFASATRVRDREQWERDNKHLRPVRWLAPEAIDPKHVPESDVWSLGVLMWEIYSEGALPHGDLADDKIVEIVNTGGRLKKPEKCSRNMYSLIQKCTSVEPSQRAKLPDVFADLPMPPVDYVNTRHQPHYVNKAMVDV